jgi:hypothetical protein
MDPDLIIGADAHELTDKEVVFLPLH